MAFNNKNSNDGVDDLDNHEKNIVIISHVHCFTENASVNILQKHMNISFISHGW